MIKLQDVIHFYLGAKAKDSEGETYKLSHHMLKHYSDLKPILRKLSDMTEEENSEYARRKQQKGYMAEVHADNTRWLLSKHIDLFGLIKSNQAIDASTEKK